MTVTGLGVASGSVPVSNASIVASWPGGKSDKYTSPTGQYRVTVPHQTAGELVSFTLTAETKTIAYPTFLGFAVYPTVPQGPNQPGSPWFWSTAAGATNMAYTVSNADAKLQDAFETFDIVLDMRAAEPQAGAAGAMAVLSIMQPYGLYAFRTLKASLPLTVGAVYPDNSRPGSFYSTKVPGQPGDGRIHIDSNDLNQEPNVVGHEMGHVVAFANAFANQNDGRDHSTRTNMRTGGLCAPADVQCAFSEGWADFFAVAAKNSPNWLTTAKSGNYLNIPGITCGNTQFAGRDITKDTGPAYGEDSEWSVARALWLLHLVGQDDTKDVTKRRIPPFAPSPNPDQDNHSLCQPAGLFKLLKDNAVSTLAGLWAAVVGMYKGNLAHPEDATGSGNANTATLGHIFQVAGVSPTIPPGDGSINAANRTVAFTTPVVTDNGTLTETPTFPATEGAAPNVKADLFLAVFNANWKQVYADNPDNPANLPKVTGSGLNGGVYNWTETLSLATWNTIASEHGLYWVIEARACTGGGEIFYWSKPYEFRAWPTPAAAKPVTATEGVPCTATVATIDNVGTADAAAGLAATVYWGDKSPATVVNTTWSPSGQIVPDAADNGGYEVDSTHTYNEFGAYAGPGLHRRRPGAVRGPGCGGNGGRRAADGDARDVPGRAGAGRRLKQPTAIRADGNETFAGA